MTREEKVFQMALAIAPTLAQDGGRLLGRLNNEGRNPQECRVGNKDIPHAYGETLREWAEAFVDELEDTVCERCTIQGSELENFAKHLNRK